MRCRVPQARGRLPIFVRVSAGGAAHAKSWRSMGLFHDDRARRACRAQHPAGALDPLLHELVAQPARSACWFRKELVKVVEAGRHEFFREPTAAELAELSEGEFPECMRYAQELKGKKRAGIRKTAKKQLATLIKQKSKKMKFANR